jgi:Fur family ferric uptake transcriptional regulator
MTTTEIAEILRSRGLRMTEPRRLVWETVVTADRHLTAHQIAERVHESDPDVNVSSVYRSLGLFAELELIRESNLGLDGASRWERAHTDDHFHLVCQQCGEVSHHAGEIVERTRAHLRTDHGFEAATIDLVVTGTCPDCAATSAATTSAATRPHPQSPRAPKMRTQGSGA